MRRETATSATQKQQTTPEATRDYLQDGGDRLLIDNHYMAQAMSDEPIDLGMCKKVHLLSGPTC
jgi:hypothetical protein